MNTSFSEGEVTNDWKIANVTAVYKKGCKSDPGNYRAVVSLTSIICKTMETVATPGRNHASTHETTYLIIEQGAVWIHIRSLNSVTTNVLMVWWGVFKCARHV